MTADTSPSAAQRWAVIDTSPWVRIAAQLEETARTISGAILAISDELR